MVSLKEYSDEELAKKSLIELAKLMMLEEKKELKFSEVFAKAATLKGLTEEEKSAKIGQFYTDLNVDGSFATNGSNTWGLKRWYKKEQKEEEETTTPLPKRLKRRKKRTEKDEDLDPEFVMINNNIDDMIVEYSEDEELDIDIDEDFDGVFDEDEEEDDD